MSNYSAMLRDPRWQKKRLEILERDEFTCQDCYSKTDTLNVHHHFYKKGAKPWEYDDDDLITYCEACHERRSELILSIQKRLGDYDNADLCNLDDILIQLPSVQALMMWMKSREVRCFMINLNSIIQVVAKDA